MNKVFVCIANEFVATGQRAVGTRILSYSKNRHIGDQESMTSIFKYLNIDI